MSQKDNTTRTISADAKDKTSRRLLDDLDRGIALLGLDPLKEEFCANPYCNERVEKPETFCRNCEIGYPDPAA